MPAIQVNDTGFNVAIVGATGAVGREILAILDQRDFPVARLQAMASARSAGAHLDAGGAQVVVEDLQHASFDGVDFALFSAGSSVSKEHARRAVAAGAVVIDNTSAFRMDPDIPLVVPELNASAIDDGPGIVANPNCSTTQMVLALAPLAEAVGLQRVVVSTYQSASGAGQAGIDELMAATRAYLDGQDDPDGQVFDHPLAFDALPHIDVFGESGFTREELKMVRETRKIMNAPGLPIAATCVRIPTVRSHCESVTVDLDSALSARRARQIWAQSAGVDVLDAPADAVYPRARQAAHTDPAWVGRVRQDLDRPATLHFWVVSDNLRKGAALNAVQIAENLVHRRRDP